MPVGSPSWHHQKNLDDKERSVLVYKEYAGKLVCWEPAWQHYFLGSMGTREHTTPSSVLGRNIPD